MTTEADTCRKYVLPKLTDAGWDDEPHSLTEQETFIDGRIVVIGEKVRRRPQKRADYLLRYNRDFTIAVVEAKPEYQTPGQGLQQAKEYAEILRLKFAYATNGHGILEFDYVTGQERLLIAFPTPDELSQRWQAGQQVSPEVARSLLTPAYHLSGKTPRYYQEIAINQTVQAILQGKRHILLTMATGTGKTDAAFQICWKLWNARGNRDGEYRRTRILYPADRNILVDDPKDKTFAAFGDARWKIDNGEAVRSREMYFAIYQAIAEYERRPGLYREYPTDFFGLIIVDECHRGSARDESNWRESLEYFQPAFQLGMTATPLCENNRDTYAYSLRQGIDDGFLAPYRVHRVLTTYDAAGWRPSKGELDRFLQEAPDREYSTPDFERIVALKARTEAIARHLADFIRRGDRFAKTIVFCVDQEHADEMRHFLSNFSSDLVQQYSDYVCRETANEGEIGRSHLSCFQELETKTPAILTTSQLLTTGVEVPTCNNVVTARVVGAMTEFTQIIGCGSRVRDDYGKLFFNILDYTGSATRLFADPEFDGCLALATEVSIDGEGQVVPGSEQVVEPEEIEADDGTPSPGSLSGDDTDQPPRKYYIDGGQVEAVAHQVYELDPDGKQLRVVKFTDYSAEKVRTMYTSAAQLRQELADPALRADIIARFEERVISFDELRSVTTSPTSTLRPAVPHGLQRPAAHPPGAGQPPALREAGLLRAIRRRGSQDSG